MAYPTDKPAAYTFSGTDTADSVNHGSDLHQTDRATIRAIIDKLGLGASTPAANQVLRGTGSGTTAFGAIATGDLAANAASQSGLAVGVTSGPTTSSGTYVDLTDMSVTLTTTGADLIAIFIGTFSHSQAANYIAVGLSLDGAAVAAESVIEAPGINYRFSLLAMHRFTSVGAASHTVKARWYTQAATATATATWRRLLVLELKK